MLASTRAGCHERVPKANELSASLAEPSSCVMNEVHAAGGVPRRRLAAAAWYFRLDPTDGLPSRGP
jgi:hypothetical protein